MADVRRARRSGDQWLCRGCDDSLATDKRAVEPGTAYLRSELVPLPQHHDGMAAYGLPQRRITGHKDQRRGLPRESGYTGPVKLPVYVYCLRKGVCGIGQVIEDRARRDSTLVV